MQPPWKHQKDEIIEYLKNNVIDKNHQLTKQSSKRNQKNITKYWNNLFIDSDRTTIVKVPSNFQLAIQNSNIEIETLEMYARKLCDIAMADEEILSFIEEYFKLKLDAHVDRKPIISNLTPLLIIMVLISILPIFFGNYLTFKANISSLIPLLLGILGVLGIIYKPFEEKKHFNTTLSYKTCIFILKRAQYKAKKIKESNSK